MQHRRRLPQVPAQNAIVISATDYADFARLAK